MKRRTLRTLIVLVLLGVASTVLVAWALAWDPGESRLPMRIALPPETPAISVSRRDAMGGVSLVAITVSGGGGAAAPEQIVGLDALAPSWTRRELLEWTRGEAGPAEGSARAMVLTGWPALSMWSSFDLEPSSGYWWYKARNGILVAPAPATPDYFALLSPRERVLPTRVAAPGFAVCTTFWGAVWGAVLLGPPAIKRAMRKRRGKCLVCGYDRRGLGMGRVCPECGGADRGGRMA